MDDELYQNLKVLPNRIRKDKDVVAVFVGSPGEGKSTFAQQVLYLFDPDISVQSIKYSYEDYVKYSTDLFNKGQSRGRGVIHDEGKEALSSMNIMTKRTRNFMNFLYENRQMNMYQFILTGDFFDLPKSIVMQRVLFTIWVKEEGEFDNGYFRFYNRKHTKQLYIKGKKTRNMTASGFTLRGTFPKFYTVDEEAYRRLKKSHLKASRYIDPAKDKEVSIKDCIQLILNRNPDVRPVDVANTLNIEPNYFFTVRKQLQVNN